MRSVIRFINAKDERPAEIHKQIVDVYGNVMNPLVSSPKETSRWENFVMTWFKGQAADLYDSGIQKLVPRLNVWTMPATMIKNKVMYRQFIHSVAFVN
jgi:hypothetical protein